MQILFGIAVIWGVLYAAKHMWDHASDGRRSSRSKAVKAAEGKASGGKLTAGQRGRVKASHDAGWWGSEVRHGFPVHRHGFSQGWNEHQKAMNDRRLAAEKARSERMEGEADTTESLTGERERQRQAQERIRKAQEPDGDPHFPDDPDGTPPLPSGHPGAPDDQPSPGDPPQDGSPPAAPPAAPPPTQNGEPMATPTETNYTAVQEHADKQAEQAEQDVANLDERLTTARELADGMLEANVDSATVSDQMELIDRLTTAREALAQAQEQATTVKTNNEQRHGGIKEAVDDAPVPEPAEMGYYQGD